MIKFRTSEIYDWEVITPTIFPDKTSQVWKLNLPSTEYYGKNATIRWNFENEGEFMHLVQLSDLLRKNGQHIQHLELPYLPYARQDKEISNETTFARDSFLAVLFMLEFKTITAYDVHSDLPMNIEFKNKRPEHFLTVISEFTPDAIFFPDEGAMKRYQSQFLDEPIFNMITKVYGQKMRNQKTGEITDYVVNAWNSKVLSGKVLILDDICDGGMTFIKAAEAIKSHKPEKIALCVSHGIFSKGVTPLANAGIKHIYTTDSLKNPELLKGILATDTSSEKPTLTIYKSL